MIKFLRKLSEVIDLIIGKNKTDDRERNYRESFFQLQNMMTQNTIEADKALATFSIAALAALAALNEKIFAPFGKLSFLTLFCFIGVILIVTLGYTISNQLLFDAQKKLTDNYLKSSTKPSNHGIGEPKFATLSQWLNRISMILFIVGIICFIVLLYSYIKEIK